jgi:hypothetical protein
MFSHYTESNDGDVSGNHGKSDAWVVKTDANGNILWQKCFGGKNNDADYHQTQIIKSMEGGYMLSTMTNSSDAQVTGLHGKPGKKWTSSTTDLGDVWLVKLDDNGNIQWQKCFGGPIWDFFENIIQTSDGNYLGSGATHGAGGDSPGNNGANGVADWWLAKISPAGNLIWSRNYGGTGAEAIHGKVFELSNGDLILPSGTRSNDHDCIGISGPPDLWIMKTDASGNILSYNIWGGIGYDNLSFAVMNNDGSLTVAAMTDSTNNDYGHDQHADLWILKLVPNVADTFAITVTSLSQNTACPDYPAFTSSVSFTKRGTFNPGNIFTAELSNAEGSFASPLIVGTLNGTSPGTISCSIPSGLPSGKYYTIRIRSSNPAYTGITSGHLINIQNCAAPSGLSTSDLTSNSIHLKWNTVPCAIQYKLQYSKSPNASWSNANSLSTTDTNANISGISGSSVYFWRVQSKCSANPNVWSEVSLTKSFTTTSIRNSFTSQEAALFISPNPVLHSATISFTLSQSQKATLKIFDINGRLILALSDKSNEAGHIHFIWDSETVDAGVYFVQLESSELIQTEKVVVIK